MWFLVLMTAERPQQTGELDAVRSSVETLFENVPYGEGTRARKIVGTLYMWDLPIVPIEVEQRQVDESSSDIIIEVSYLLFDTTRTDQSVTYTLPAGADEPTIEQYVVFGDYWGREVPSEPFSKEPQTPLTTMRLAIDLVREKREQALRAGHGRLWRAQ